MQGQELRAELVDLKGKLEDSKTQLQSNEQMIRWLNQQVRTKCGLLHTTGSAGKRMLGGFTKPGSKWKGLGHFFLGYSQLRSTRRLCNGYSQLTLFVAGLPS